MICCFLEYCRYNPSIQLSIAVLGPLRKDGIPLKCIMSNMRFYDPDNGIEKYFLIATYGSFAKRFICNKVTKHRFMNRSVGLSVCLSVSWSVCLSVCPSVASQFVFLSVYRHVVYHFFRAFWPSRSDSAVYMAVFA